MRRHLSETIQIQLPDKARNIFRFEDGIARVEILFLKFLVVEKNGVAVKAPTNGTAPAFVHYTPQFLRESQRKEYAIVVHA